MKEPISLNPDVKALLDGAYAEKSAAERQRQAAEIDRAAKEREALEAAGRTLDQVVRPGLDALCAYLKARGDASEVQRVNHGGHTLELRLVWGRTARPIPVARTQHAQQNTFRVSMRADGTLATTSAMMGEDYQAHEGAPDPITTDWIQAEGAKAIKRAIGA